VELFAQVVPTTQLVALYKNHEVPGVKAMLKLTLLVVIGLAAVAVAETTRWHQLQDYSFDKYVKEFGKEYRGQEYERRKAVFEANLNDIRSHNLDDSKTWKRGVNQLTDSTPQELRRLLGLDKGLLHASKAKNAARIPIDHTPVDLSDLPGAIDWRDRGVVSAVKDQGQCGSCWTFGTAETVETHWAIRNKQLTDLSEQQILDCTPNTNDCGGTGGCGGGTAELAYQKIMQLGGLTTEWLYPYVSYWGNNFKCSFNSSVTRPFAKLTNYVVLPSNEYAPVLKALVNVGPLAINVDASAWFSYESGVFDGCNQTNPDIDHVVQLVGYGSDTKYGDYWLVRNSWTPAWGEYGYIRLRRDAVKQQCGMDIKPQDGTGCNGGPTEVKVCGACGLLYDVSYPVVASL